MEGWTDRRRDGMRDGQTDEQKTADSRQHTADSRQHTADRRQKTAERREADRQKVRQAGLAEPLFDASLNIKGLLYRRREVPVSEESSHTAPTSHGVRLPKLDVPTFDGDILNWRTFWEQFCIAIHDCAHLSDAEKLAYLRHALKDGTAKSTIEGLSRSWDHYAEAVKCLETRYNRPKLIHQVHVKKICRDPSFEGW